MRPQLPKLSKFEIAIAGLGLVVFVLSGLLTSRDATGLLRNTLWLAVCVMCVSIPVAALLAYCVSFCEVKWSGFWQSCLLTLLFVPLYIQLASWEAGFGRDGWYSNLIAEKLSYPPLEGFRGAVLVHAFAAIPWLFGIFRLGFAAVPRTYLESASLDASPWEVFRRITLPMTLPVLLAGCLYVVNVASTEITVTDRYQYRSYAEVLFTEFNLKQPTAELLVYIAPILMTLVGVTCAGLLLCKLLWPLLSQLTIGREQPRKSVNWFATAIVASVVGLLVLVPLCNLVYQAGIHVAEGSDGRIRSWSLATLFAWVKNGVFEYREAIAYTAILTQFSVLLSLALAMLFVWWSRGKSWRQILFAFVATFCFVLPGPLIGLGLIWLVNREGPFFAWLYDDTLFVPIAALTIRFFPYAYLILWYGVSTIPKSITDAASVDGASNLQSLWHVVLPSLRPSLICAGLVGLAVGVGELSSTMLGMPPGVTTVAREVARQIHYGAQPQLAGFCLACLGILVVLGLVSQKAFSSLVRPRGMRN